HVPIISPWPILRVQYLNGRGLLRRILAEVTRSGFVITGITTTTHRSGHQTTLHQQNGDESVEVKVQLRGRGDLDLLASVLSEIDGVLHIITTHTGDSNE